MDHCSCPPELQDNRCGGYPDGLYDIGCHVLGPGFGGKNMNWWCRYHTKRKYSYMQVQEQMSRMM